MRGTLDRSHTKISTSIKRMEFESIEEKCASIRNSLNLSVEIYRWSPRARFLREKGRLPLPPCSPEKRLPSPIYVSPIRIASNCGDSFRTCVQIRCPLHRESYLTGWSISFRFNPWNAIHHSWDSPREKRKKLNPSRNARRFIVPTYTHVYLIVLITISRTDAVESVCFRPAERWIFEEETN